MNSKGEIIRFKHHGPSGDLIGALPGIRQVFRNTGKKAVIMQQLDMPSFTYPNCTPAVFDAKGTAVFMSLGQYTKLKPLIEFQPYIERMEVWEGQEFDVSLDTIREGHFTQQPAGILQRWHFYLYPQMACDLHETWLDLPESCPLDIGKKVVLNFTQRYRNPLISYYFLKRYEDSLIFAGTPDEHKIFCEKYNLSIPRLVVQDFLEGAWAIKQSPFFMGNQSMCYHIAEGMGHTRILESCAQFPNTFPLTPDGYDYLHQDAVEYYFETLYREKYAKSH
jgi:hypothetical protein